MLQSYEAVYDHGWLRWLHGQPACEEARVIVTILAEPHANAPAVHLPSPRIAGQGRILGDIVAPIATPDEWECLK